VTLESERVVLIGLRWNQLSRVLKKSLQFHSMIG